MKSMKMAVVCANGKAGRLIVEKAVERGIEVTAVVRGENRSSAQNVIKKDLFSLVPEDLAGFDAVIDAFGAWTPETLPQHSSSLKHLCDLLSGTGTRLLVVGGAGSLYVNPDHTAQVMDGPDFPEAFVPLAGSMGQALDELRKRKDVRWTYLSPACDFRADGGETGKYLFGGEELFLNAKGESVICFRHDRRGHKRKPYQRTDLCDRSIARPHSLLPSAVRSISLPAFRRNSLRPESRIQRNHRFPGY